MSWIRKPSERLLTAEPELRTGPITLRIEAPGDAPQIRALLEASFVGFAEAILIDRLRSDGAIVLSLVAEDEGVVIGYVAFSRLWIESAETRFPAVALAPLAVYSDYQQQGVATRLLREAHACLAALGESLSIVVGEPQYYGRFGYSNRRVAGFVCEYQSSYLMGLSFGAAPREGTLVYPNAFSALSEDAALQADDRI